MPGVQKLAQESETQSKPEFIHGHLFGGVSVVAGRRDNNASLKSIPLLLKLQSGISHMLTWIREPITADMEKDAQERQKGINRAIKDLELSSESSITHLVELACQSAKLLGKKHISLQIEHSLP